jgi:hypothetical protein
VAEPLGRPKAALWLLDAIEGHNVSPPDEHASWLRDICLTVVGESIEETADAYVKTAGKKAKPDKTAEAKAGAVAP